ncbi:transmembrane protein 45A [Loxodonta africana]|nr:transmembrane protein 45A [Loxodonta africana]XP_023414817.1 transmembrane protein 45A [Loxodonta africana]XP_049714006.1 transmembrane protein 45A [Elephas maximus indicus]XP_049714007.1 transmembrane protein 45A [Elephas maximus indicus]
MGSFRGHALPGSFFCFISLWWSMKYILKYACKKYKRTCYLGSKALFHRVEVLEGIIIVGMALSGMTWEQFVPGGPHLTLYDYEEGQWNQLLEWQHCTMYFFFGLFGVTNILCYTSCSLPVSLAKLMMSNAFFVEAFVFYNHTHGRDMLDVYVHQLLLLVIIVTGLITFIDFMRSNIILELLQPSFILLQGTWFWQIGFVLYPPSGGPAWEPTDHDNIMFVSICFCWHYMFSLIIVGLIYVFVTWLVKSKLKRACPSEVGLLKNAEREQELEEEMGF